jgi:hypothetical protein
LYSSRVSPRWSVFPVLAYLWLVGSVGASIKVTSQPPPPLNLRLPTAALRKSLSQAFIVFHIHRRRRCVQLTMPLSCIFIS